MEVVISESAFRVVCAELDRVAPAEGLCVPLVALEVDGDNGWAAKRLSDLKRVVIAQVFPLPASLQRNAALSVEALPAADVWMNARVREALRRHPRLRPAAFLHSHPFAWNATWPSFGDYRGHMKPLLAQNRTAGLHASFSVIAARCETGWRLCLFALDEHATIVNLGAAQVVPDDTACVRRALAAREPMRSALRHYRRSLKKAGCRVRSEELFDGWTRLRIDDGFVAFASLDFPNEKVRTHAL